MPPVPVPSNAPPVPPPAPADPNADWTAAEKKWFEENGVTDEKEKEVIRGRSRVMAYDRAKQKFETEKAAPPEPKAKKKWYESSDDAA